MAELNNRGWSVLCLKRSVLVFVKRVLVLIAVKAGRRTNQEKLEWKAKV